MTPKTHSPLSPVINKTLLPLLVLVFPIYAFHTNTSEMHLSGDTSLYFQLGIDLDETQYLTDLTITAEHLDGHCEVTTVKNLKSGLHPVWKKDYVATLQYIRIKAQIYTGDLLDPVKTLVDMTYSDIVPGGSFTITLGGSYRRPYVNKTISDHRVAVRP